MSRVFPPSYRVARAPARPLVLFDGDCRFCRRWTDSWRRSWGARLDLEASQSACVRFPEISAPAFDSALQLVEPDGSVFSGAYAALRARAHGGGTRGLLLPLYEKIPGAAPVLEFFYRVVAQNRRIFSLLIRR